MNLGQAGAGIPGAFGLGGGVFFRTCAGRLRSLLVGGFLRKAQVTQARHALVALALRLFLLLDDLVVFLLSGCEMLLCPCLARLPHVGIPSCCFFAAGAKPLGGPRPADRKSVV